MFPSTSQRSRSFSLAFLCALVLWIFATWTGTRREQGSCVPTRAPHYHSPFPFLSAAIAGIRGEGSNWGERCERGGGRGDGNGLLLVVHGRAARVAPSGDPCHVPQIKEPFSPDPWAFLKIAAVVSLQLWTATLRDADWLKILTVAYFFGSFLNHNLFLAIHELSHNLAFRTPALNRWLGIFANLPIGVPMSITFQKYHLEHHRFQGVDGIDMDIPSQAEAHAVKNAISKSVWVVLQLFFYALRPLFLKPKPPGLWEPDRA